MSSLQLYNSYSRQKEVFEPITPGHVGLYVCGPTVSGESHLGHARPYITFDVVNRYLRYLGYKVRYVRNITDAGHFEEEGRAAEDKVATKAILEMLEPMELVQKYTNLFHWGMRKFNTIEPSIEPTATGHIIEQIEMIKTIIEKGYAYEINGSVYFDVKKYNENYKNSNDKNVYGKLSGRILEDLLETTRDLDGQDEKREKVDFALWKKAPPEHLMRWPSPWGEGFPGWHIECSAMSSKYLGEKFDIHGGGMDLQFPHHESEIAQSTIAHGCAPVNYWMHNNMITINGKKMGKSYNNVIKLTELFSGDHPLLAQAYHPMVIRFYILTTHYRSTLDFSNDALQASEKALKRLWEAYEQISNIDTNLFKKGLFKDLILNEKDIEIPQNKKDIIDELEDILSNNSLIDFYSNKFQDLNKLGEIVLQTREFNDSNKNFLLFNLVKQIFIDLNDDFNTAKVIATLFDIIPSINSILSNKEYSKYYRETIILFKKIFEEVIKRILGLQSLKESDNSKLDGVLQLVIDMRKDAKTRKDYAASDKIRDTLAQIGIQLKDEKDGSISYSIL